MIVIVELPIVIDEPLRDRYVGFPIGGGKVMDEIVRDSASDADAVERARDAVLRAHPALESVLQVPFVAELGHA